VAAQRIGNLVATTSLEEAAQGVSVAVLCCPVEAMPALGARLSDCLPETAWVTDAGSVKSPVVDAMEKIFGGRFVGAHPMAGSEQSGPHAASGSLYQGSTCILTPTEVTSPEALQAVKALWASVGCSLKELSPQEHDAAVARVSHLPHLVASALVAAVNSRPPDVRPYAGKGYSDTTRIAAGPSAMWSEICLANRREISQTLAETIEILQRVKHDLDEANSESLQSFLEQSRTWRSEKPPDS